VNLADDARFLIADDYLGASPANERGVVDGRRF
jgi:hypothetical protein